MGFVMAEPSVVSLGSALNRRETRPKPDKTNLEGGYCPPGFVGGGQSSKPSLLGRRHEHPAGYARMRRSRLWSGQVAAARDFSRAERKWRFVWFSAGLVAKPVGRNQVAGGVLSPWFRPGLAPVQPLQG